MGAKGKFERHWMVNKSNFGHIDSFISWLEAKIVEFDCISNSRPLDDLEFLERKICHLELWKWLKNKESL